MKEKDIYEYLNNLNIETIDEEISLNKIDKKRIKRRLYKKIFYNNKRRYLIVALLFLSFIFVISPIGKDVIAKIKEKLVFSASHGIISLEEDKEIYMLEEPFKVNINNKDILVKGIIKKGENLFVQIISESYPEEVKEIASGIKIKLEDGEVINIDGYGIGFSTTSIIEVGINIKNKKVNKFVLMFKDEELKEVTLEKAEYKYNYNDIGGNIDNKGILIGGTSYYVQGERYFRLWNDESAISSKQYNVSIGNIKIDKVLDEGGKSLNFEASNDGTGKEYKILEEYNGKINIEIKEISLEYKFKNPAKITIKDPKYAGDYKLNQELSFEGIDDIAKITEVKRSNDEVVIGLDFSNNNSSDRFIYMVLDSSKYSGGMGNMENLIGEINIDYEDISIFEKLTRKINLKLDDIDILQKGNWKFTIE